MNIIKVLLILPFFTASAWANCPPKNQMNSHEIIPRFIDNKDGTINDKKTNLMWAKCSLGQKINDCSGEPSLFDWNIGLDKVKRSKLAGHADWRLPTSKELQTIVDLRHCSPETNAKLFPNTPYFVFWQAPPSDKGSYYASDPLQYYGHTDVGKPIRLVRKTK